MLERRGGVYVGVHLRAGLEVLVRMTARDAHHLHHVVHPLGAQRVGVHRLVGERELVVEHVEMAHRGVKVHRLDRVAAGEMDAVEILRELEQRAALLARAGHLAADLHVPVVGRRRDVAEQDMAPAHGDPAVRVARGDVPLRGAFRHHLHHQGAVHADHLTVHVAAGAAQDLHRVGVQKGDADLLEDAHGAVVDRLNARLVQRLDRRIGIDRQAPGRLLDRGVPPARGGTGTTPAPPASGGGVVFCALCFARHRWDSHVAVSGIQRSPDQASRVWMRRVASDSRDHGPLSASRSLRADGTARHGPTRRCAADAGCGAPGAHRARRAALRAARSAPLIPARRSAAPHAPPLRRRANASAPGPKRAQSCAPRPVPPAGAA